FIFYFGIISNITPPVALASIVASGISGAGSMGTSLTALRLGLPAFILPFIFVFEPALILKGEVSDTIISTVTALIGLFALSYCTQQFYKRNLRIWESALFLVLAVILIYPSLVLGV